MPELPDEKKKRFVAEYGLPVYDAGVLVADRDTAAFYETVAEGRDGKLAANWVIGDYFALLNKSGATLATAPVDAAGLGGLLDLIADGTVSGRLAKEVFEAMWETGKPAAVIVDEKGLRQISDTGAIETAIDEVLAREQGKLAEYRSGKDKLFGFFVGQVMKATGGKANPKLVNELLKAKL
jgi:aspartyl-tRNA(Asn)/glutamyl-tRNA(Gln) amidotransferase subunit B